MRTSRIPDAVMRKAQQDMLDGKSIEAIHKELAGRNNDPFLAEVARMVSQELIRTVRIRTRKERQIERTFVATGPDALNRYYHPTKGWRLPRKLRRKGFPATATPTKG